MEEAPLFAPKYQSTGPFIIAMFVILLVFAILIFVLALTKPTPKPVDVPISIFPAR